VSGRAWRSQKTQKKAKKKPKIKPQLRGFLVRIEGLKIEYGDQ
jgi:hypothetical protein